MSPQELKGLRGSEVHVSRQDVRRAHRVEARARDRVRTAAGDIAHHHMGPAVKSAHTRSYLDQENDPQRRFVDGRDEA